MNANETGTVTEQLIDVRSLPARERHPTVFGTWGGLPAGGAMLLVNDHDPVPLYYQFVCEHAGRFHWEYLEQGPEVWRVRIAKGDFPDPGFVPSQARVAPREAARASVPPVTLDVRPYFARGDTPCTAIDEAAAAVVPGQALILLVPFEPMPLYAKFDQQGFSHRSERLPDGTWRIEFLRGAVGPAGAARPVPCACGG